MVPSEIHDVACVDVDGNCSGSSGDDVDLCGCLDVSLITGGACQVYADPAAADPTLHVFILAKTIVKDEGM